MFNSLREYLWSRRETCLMASAIGFAAVGGTLAGIEVVALGDDPALGASMGIFVVPLVVVTTAASCATWQEFHLSRAGELDTPTAD